MHGHPPPLFPPLPPVSESQDDTYWSEDIKSAYDVVSNAYIRASQLLRQEDGDPIRLRIHSNLLSTQMVPILVALETTLPNNQDWVASCAHALGSMIRELNDAEIVSQQVEESRLHYIQSELVTAIRSGKRGRPRKIIDEIFLNMSMSPQRRISGVKLSKSLGIHRHTLRSEAKRQGIDRSFCTIPDDELDIIVREFKRLKPSSGLRYLQGFIQNHGLRIQKERLRLSLGRVDKLGQVVRSHHTISRQPYKVARPNALWHLDGHHKLIMYGIVVHGFIDGFCRTVVGLQASTNNKATTVFDLFIRSKNKYGRPSRVRGDRGGENILVAVDMIEQQGPNRASFLWGGSVRNSRIERFWGELGSQVLRRWRAFLLRLENLHQLDKSKPEHLWLLHTLFLDQINSEIENFRQEWNLHPVSGAGHNMSPADMRLLGQLDHGFRTDVHDGSIHPDIVRRYSSTGSISEIGEQIAAEQQDNVRHEAIPVPQHGCPFEDVQNISLFRSIVADSDMQSIIPEGFGVARHEWNEDGYPETELIRCGRGGKYVTIDLPFRIWWVRAVEWCRGLEVMVTLSTTA